jgi:hypothetical protein
LIGVAFKPESRPSAPTTAKQRGADAGKFMRKEAGAVLATSLTKRASITQSQADSAERRYLSGQLR